MTMEEADKLQKMVHSVSGSDPYSKYKKLEKIGQGGTGNVFRGKTINGDKDVAIKIMPISCAKGTMLIEDRLISEINIHRNYPHQHIVQYYDSYFFESDLWVVMDYIDGVPLYKVLGCGITPLHLAAIGKAVLKVLCHLHSNNIMHRDIKSDNVLLGKDGSEKVIDFGLATYNTGNVTGVLGTYAWMAPEQVKAEVYDECIDMWAFGITMIEMLNGKAPYEDEPDEKIIEQIKLNGKPTFPGEDKLDAQLKDVLNRCLQVDRKMRTSAKDLLCHPVFTNASHQDTQLVKELVDKYISSKPNNSG